MGYNTTYYITVEQDPQDHADQYLEKLQEISGNPIIQLESGFNDIWQSYKEDLLEASKAYPEILVCVEGQGDDATDIWKLYVRNGEYKELRGVVVFPEFDPSGLSMPPKKKFLVTTYYTYSATVEVEADSKEEAADIGREMADNLPMEEMTYVDRDETLVTPCKEDGTPDYEQSPEEF